MGMPTRVAILLLWFPLGSVSRRVESRRRRGRTTAAALTPPADVALASWRPPDAT